MPPECQMLEDWRWEKQNCKVHDNVTGHRNSIRYGCVETFSPRETWIPQSFERGTELEVDRDHGKTLENQYNDDDVAEPPFKGHDTNSSVLEHN
jgi:hypothetical protein